LEREVSFNGRHINIDTFIIKTVNGGVGGALALVNDVTEKYRMEERMKLLDRMAALGEISAGVAHEIENPLASIRGASELIKEGKGKKKELISMIIGEVERLDVVVKNFLEYAREAEVSLGPVDLKEVVNDTVTLLKVNPLWTEEIDIDINISDNIVVEADRARIKEAFLNIGLNALKALKEKGNLRIDVETNNEMVGIHFQDNGCGMDEEEKKKIFTPFFSTDPEGFGFGLSISHKIVELHGGYIDVESCKGERSTFTVWLRRHSEG
jgi:signal transduction histidine kinase